MSVFWNVDFNSVHVWKLFCGVKERKSTGPEGIRVWVLKNCAFQLADIFSYIFQLSLKLHTVPCLWKDSVIVPVPKIKFPKTLRLQTSSTHVSCDEDFWKVDKRSALADVLQFAYRSRRGVEDATGTLLDTLRGPSPWPAYFLSTSPRRFNASSPTF